MLLPERQVYSIGFVYLHNGILVPLCIRYEQKFHVLFVGPVHVVRCILMAMMCWSMDIQASITNYMYL